MAKAITPLASDLGGASSRLCTHPKVNGGDIARARKETERRGIVRHGHAGDDI